MMKSGNCFTVEYILGTRDNKPKESIAKGKFNDKAIEREDEKRSRTESKNDMKHEKDNDHEDQLIITSTKGMHSLLSFINMS